MSYKDLIRQHLIEHGHITSFEAFSLYGNTRLSATIYLLRHDDGINIINKPCHSFNRYGKTTHYEDYILCGDDK